MELIDKKTFRKQMLAKRDALPEEVRRAADEARTTRILSWERYKTAELLLLYVSYRSEADTKALLGEALRTGKTVAVPKVEGQDMVFYRITDLSQLIEGYRGILEPYTERTEPVEYDMYSEEKTMLFVPGCAFDENGGRMGYGGGFYDRYMEAHPRFYRVALGFEAQLTEAVPREAHDKTVDVIVTEERMMENEYSPRGRKAMELFKEGYNCAQAVVLAYEDYFEENPETLAAMISSFGGGMGRLREVCGAVSGMFFVAGKLYGYSDPKAGKEKMDHYARIQEMAASFRERNGSIVCRELLGLQEKVSVPVPEERTAEYYKKRPCGELVADAASILERYIEKHPVE